MPGTPSIASTFPFKIRSIIELFIPGCESEGSWLKSGLQSVKIVSIMMEIDFMECILVNCLKIKVKKFKAIMSFIAELIILRIIALFLKQLSEPLCF